MAIEPKRYKSAPILEAVIEIRVEPSPSIDRAALKDLADSLRADFSKQAQMQLVQIAIGPLSSAPGVGPVDMQMLQQPSLPAVGQPAVPPHIGYRLTTSNDSRILQLRSDGFAFSHMAPYSDWASFRAEAQALWQKYAAICPGVKRTRCAVRYINRVDIPNARIEIEDYFSLYPKVPEKLTQQDVVGMTLTLNMPQADLECMAVINQAQMAPTRNDHVLFMLDIDVFRLGIEAWGDAQIWEFLDRLRDRKNEIFEACITDRTRELIDQ